MPLPPHATPRQIQDRTEAWLREEAARHLTRLINEKSALAGRRVPRLALSFARRGHWIEAQGTDILRCHWRLIEQPAAVIAQAIECALAALPPAQRVVDLFAAADI